MRVKSLQKTRMGRNSGYLLFLVRRVKENHLRNLSVLDRCPVVVSRRVEKSERRLLIANAAVGDLGETLCPVVTVRTLGSTR